MKTELKITLRVTDDVEFSARTETIAEAYRYIEAIISSHPIEFPDRDAVLSEYMSILVDFKDAGKFSHDCHVFKIEFEG